MHPPLLTQSSEQTKKSFSDLVLSRFCGWVDVGLSKLGEREAETAGEALLASGFRSHSLKMQITKFIMIMIINVTHYPSANDNDQADNSIHLVTDEGANNT